MNTLIGIKSYFSNSESIEKILMKKVKEIESGGFYVLKGISAGNTHMFEDVEEKLKFQWLVNIYLGKLMEVREYCLTEDVWMMVVKLKSKETIRKYFEEYKSNSETKGEQFVESWQQISEMVRICLNQYSRWVNYKRGRIGSLVGKSYERYYFETGEEAITWIGEMREGKVEKSQPKVKFQPMEQYYDKASMEGENMWVRTSKMVQEGKKMAEEIGLKCLYLWELSYSVASDLVESTLKLHKLKNFQKSNPSSS